MDGESHGIINHSLNDCTARVAPFSVSLEHGSYCLAASYGVEDFTPHDPACYTIVES